MKAIVEATIKTDMPLEDIMRVAREDQLASVPGLLRKFWMRDSRSGDYQLLLEFDGMDSVKQCLEEGFETYAAKAYQTTEPVKAKIYYVLKERDMRDY